MFLAELSRPYGTSRAATCGRCPTFHPGLLSRRPYVTAPIVVCTIGILATTACSRPPTPASAASQPTALGPRATLVRLLNLRTNQQYADISPLILPPHGASVVTFLTAVDEFLAANRRLCGWLRDHAGVGLSQTIDQSYVADDLSVYAGEDLGVFSQHVELLDEAVVTDQATVIYTVENRLPAKRVRLRNVRGAWWFDPSHTCPDELPAAFRDMARGLESLLAEFEHGSIDVAPLRDDPKLLMEKVKARLRRGVNLLSKAQAAAGPPE